MPTRRTTRRPTPAPAVPAGRACTRACSRTSGSTCCTYYTDPFETTWINEGLSDFAQTLTGYVDARLTIDQKGADSHIYCFQGFGIVLTPFNPNPRDCGGAENSLNIWDEGVPAAVLADYGNAYSLMLFLFDRYGTDVHVGAAPGRRSAGPGEPGRPARERSGSATSTRCCTTSRRSTLLDRIVGNPPFGIVLGVPKSRVTSASLNSTVNLANPQSYDDAGGGPQRRGLRATAERQRQRSCADVTCGA